MAQDKLQGAPFGTGFRPSDHAALRHGRPGFNPSRMALLPMDEDARSFNDSALPSVMIWAGGDAYEDLVERNALPATDPRSLDLDAWAIAVGVYRAMTEAAARVLRASDERPSGRDLQGLGGDSPASAVVVANSEDEASDPEASGLSVTEAICLDKLKKERDAYREALRPFAEEAERISREWPSMNSPDMKWQVKFRHLDRARTLLSQSSEGE